MLAFQLWYIKTQVLLESKLLVQFYPKICRKGDVYVTCRAEAPVQVDCKVMMRPFGTYINVKTQECSFTIVSFQGLRYMLPGPTLPVASLSSTIEMY